MKGRTQISDRISVLPQDTIEKILSHMPIRDALRTSILSKKWRYCWTRIPKLVFDDNLVESDSDDEVMNSNKFVKAISHVLLLHRAPILEFSLSVVEKEIVSDIDQIILHLSIRHNIKKFTFEALGIHYKLPSSFFSLQGLEHLSLSYCEIELPLAFIGFSKLKSLRFDGIYPTVVLTFLTKSPLLEEFKWIKEDIEITECELVNLFKCLPLVRFLKISNFCIKHLAAGSNIPHTLPIRLVHLKKLVIGVCLFELSTVLCVIRSSPNLEKIKVEMCCNHDRRCLQQTSKNLLDDIQEEYTLDHLKEMVITRFHTHALEMEFVKIIMANSPVLKRARIKLNPDVPVDEEVKMLRGLVNKPFPRASPAVNFAIKRQKYFSCSCCFHLWQGKKVQMMLNARNIEHQ